MYLYFENNISDVDVVKRYNEAFKRISKEQKQYLQVEMMGSMDKANNFMDIYPFFNLRKFFVFLRAYYIQLCIIITESTLFDFLIMIIIMANS